MNIKEKNWRKNCYLFNWMCKFLIFSIFLISFISCQTLFKKVIIPDNLSAYKSGTFSGSVTVYQKKQKNYFSGEVFISKTGELRMDLSVSPGLSVFTMFLDKSDVTFLFLKTKEFYKGRNTDDIPESFFPKNWDLFSFKTVFFDRKPENGKWICTTDKQNLPQKCKNKDWLIQWKRGKTRTISFESSNFYFSFQYFSFSPEVDDQLFSVKIPKNFKRVFFLK